MIRAWYCLFLCITVATTTAEEPSSIPKEIPLTRSQQKQALEALKKRHARLPLPRPTEEELKPQEGSTSALGRGVVNNGRMRNLYLPPELRSGNSRTPRGDRPQDPIMTLGNAFGVELFWIASRANNCHYCLGHQEVKLISAGLEESRIAALDANWDRFTPAEQAAYGFARKLTLRPDQITADDVNSLLEHYKPLQVLEIVHLVSRYNATNRWTDSLGIPQELYREFLTPTPEEFEDAPLIVAPKRLDRRPPLPAREATLAELEKARGRKPRLPLVENAVANEVLGTNSDATQPAWIRLLGNFPVTGKSQIESYLAAADKGRLTPELKAQIAWTAARQDRALYAIDRASRRLQKLGYTQAQVFELDQLADQPLDGPSQVMAFTRKLTSVPQAIADADIANLRKHYKDEEVAEIVYHVTMAAYFDRLTEAAGLPLDK